MPKLRWAAAALAALAALYAAVTVPAALRPEPGVDTVLFFDGVCNLCDGFVNFVADGDAEPPNHRVRFGAQQKHMELLERVGAPTDLSTLVLIQGDKHYLYSSAALRTLRSLDEQVLLQAFLLCSAERLFRHAGRLRQRGRAAAGPLVQNPCRQGGPAQVWDQRGRGSCAPRGQQPRVHFVRPLTLDPNGRC